MIIGGVITSQNIGGNISTTVHRFYDHIVDPIDVGSPNSKRAVQDKFDKKYLADQFCQCLASLKLELAWKAAFELNKSKYWMIIPKLPPLEIDLIKYIYMKYQDELSKEDNFRNRLCENLIFN
jgi:hypothetical protein